MMSGTSEEHVQTREKLIYSILNTRDYIEWPRLHSQAMELTITDLTVLNVECEFTYLYYDQLQVSYS